MIDKYLIEIQTPKVLYHAASMLTKTLVPRKSLVAKYPKDAKHAGSVKRIIIRKWDKKAIYAAEEEDQALPFGLERVNILWPNRYTEEEVNAWTKACWLSVKNMRLQVFYFNHIPRNPVYLYLVDPKDFKAIGEGPKLVVKQWYSSKTITPIEVKKYLPNQIRDSWGKASRGEWERKKQKYREKGWYK